ncbi:hypothetical protein HMPREF9296_1354 [Prevotella disiens FB035-09AN]|uniref:Uncharacterized protein n=1 Tax=Prevotella disiens FB035-09AN TaxID=866771 RepID=E1KQE0_9BACT|nr:hypothetical protein HMPREF9296_1354 [Prevotella disiens FB035-09AN]
MLNWLVDTFLSSKCHESKKIIRIPLPLYQFFFVTLHYYKFTL